MAWFVYLARCADGTLYTGVTTDPARRERAHNRGRGAAYTRSRRPVRLVHLEPAPDRGAALRRELAIKGMTREKKEALMAAQGRRGAGAQVRGVLGRRRSGFFAGFGGTTGRTGSSDNRAVYETRVRDPMRALVEEMDVRLARIAPELIGRSPALGLPDPPRRPVLPRQVALQDQRRLPVLPSGRGARGGAGRRRGGCGTVFPAGGRGMLRGRWSLDAGSAVAGPGA